jgi:hypothetical protein
MRGKLIPVSFNELFGGTFAETSRIDNVFVFVCNSTSLPFRGAAAERSN